MASGSEPLSTRLTFAAAMRWGVNVSKETERPTTRGSPARPKATRNARAFLLERAAHASPAADTMKHNASCASKENRAGKVAVTCTAPTASASLQSSSKLGSPGLGGGGGGGEERGARGRDGS